MPYAYEEIFRFKFQPTFDWRIDAGVPASEIAKLDAITKMFNNTVNAALYVWLKYGMQLQTVSVAQIPQFVSALVQSDKHLREYSQALGVYSTIIQQAGKATAGFGMDIDATGAAQMSFMKRLFMIRWELFTLMFLVGVAGKTITSVFRSMEEAARLKGAVEAAHNLAEAYGVDLPKVVEGLREASYGTLTQAQIMSLASRALVSGAASFAERLPEIYAIARAVAVATGRDVEDVFLTLVRGISRAEPRIIKSADVYIDGARALEQYAVAHGKAVTELTLHDKQAAYLNATLEYGSKIMRAVGEDAVQATAPFERLKVTWKSLGAVINEELRPIGEWLSNVLNTALQTLMRLYVMFQTARSGFIGFFEGLGEVVLQWRLFTHPPLFEYIAQRWDTVMGRSVERAKETFWRYSESAGLATRSTERATAAIGELGEEVEDAASDVDRLVDRLVSLAMSADEARVEHIKALQQIREAYSERTAEAARKYVDAVKKAEADAAKAREKAYEDYRKRLRDLQRRAQQDERNDEARHQLEIEFMYRRHWLALLQSQRLYEYERAQLVARGDVLAIEDLDARHEMERQAAEENFQLQLEYQQRLWALQREQQRAALQEQLRDLREALAEQLREIDERKREQIQQARERYDEEMLDAESYRLKRQIEEEADHRERMRKQAERWAEFLQQEGVGYDKALKLVHEYFGPDGEVDQVFTDFWNRQMRYAEMFRRVLTQAVTSLPRPTWSDVGTWRVRPRQFGGDEIVSRPTLFLAGERGPERVTIRPLTVPSTVRLAWTGGPIPVMGTGGLQGLDFSRLADAVAERVIAVFADALQA